MPTQPVTELPLAFERVGNGPQPILFVHGSFASSRWWQPVAELLPADEFTCYLPDLCGCGRSRRSEDPASYRVEQQVADLSALIEQLDLYNLHLVGHSLGAAIALTYAATNPTRLRSLTLVSTPSPAGTPTPPEGYELLEQMRSRPRLAEPGAGQYHAGAGAGRVLPTVGGRCTGAGARGIYRHGGSP